MVNVSSISDDKLLIDHLPDIKSLLSFLSLLSYISISVFEVLSSSVSAPAFDFLLGNVIPAFKARSLRCKFLNFSFNFLHHES